LNCLAIINHYLFVILFTNDRQRKNEKYVSKEEAIRELMARKTSENKRYMELYGADCSDFSNFDLVIDTSVLTPKEVADKIIDGYQEWLGVG